MNVATRTHGADSTLGERPAIAAGLVWIAAACLGLAIAAAVLTVDVRIVVAAAALFALLLLGLRYPFVAVLMYLAAAMIRPEELRLYPAFLHLERILALMAVAAVFLPQVLRRRWRPWRWETTDRAVILLILAGCVSAPFSVARPWALNGCYELAKLGFFYAAIRYVATSVPRLRAVVWTMLLATAFAGLMALYLRGAGQVYIGEYGVVRAEGPTSTTGDPNILADALIAMLPFAILLVGAVRHRLAKIAHIGAAGFFLYVAALTGGRAAMVSLLAILLVMVGQSRQRILGFVVAAACLAAVWSATPPDLKERYRTLRNYQNESTYQGRLNNLKLGLLMFRDRPLTGYGVTCFRIARVERYDGQWSDAHNLLAQVAGEMGLPGVAAFAFLLWASVSAAWRARRTLRQLGGALEPDQAWLERLAMAVVVMFVGLLVQALGSHSLLRWFFYGGAALAANSLALARDAARKAAQAVSIG